MVDRIAFEPEGVRFDGALVPWGMNPDDLEAVLGPARASSARILAFDHAGVTAMTTRTGGIMELEVYLDGVPIDTYRSRLVEGGLRPFAGDVLVLGDDVRRLGPDAPRRRPLGSPGSGGFDHYDHVVRCTRRPPDSGPVGEVSVWTSIRSPRRRADPPMPTERGSVAFDNFGFKLAVLERLAHEGRVSFGRSSMPEMEEFEVKIEQLDDLEFRRRYSEEYGRQYDEIVAENRAWFGRLQVSLDDAATIEVIGETDGIEVGTATFPEWDGEAGGEDLEVWDISDAELALFRGGGRAGTPARGAARAAGAAAGS